MSFWKRLFGTGLPKPVVNAEAAKSEICAAAPESTVRHDQAVPYETPSVSPPASRPTETPRIVPPNHFTAAVQLLHHAILRGDQEQVRVLSSLNPGNVNAQHEDGSGTALHRAASCGDARIVTDLLAVGADPNARDDDGETPLHMTAYGIGGTFDRGGHARIVKLLVEAGADVNLRDNRGDTARDYAIRQHKPGMGEVVAALEPAFGQTPEEVERILGAPQKKIDLDGDKKLFLYKDLKVFFHDGKVSEIR